MFECQGHTARPLPARRCPSLNSLQGLPVCLCAGVENSALEPSSPQGAAPGSRPNWGTGGTSRSLFPTQGPGGRAHLAGRGGRGRLRDSGKACRQYPRMNFCLSVEIFNQESSKLFDY